MPSEKFIFPIRLNIVSLNIVFRFLHRCCCLALPGHVIAQRYFQRLNPLTADFIRSLRLGQQRQHRVQIGLTVFKLRGNLGELLISGAVTPGASGAGCDLFCTHTRQSSAPALLRLALLAQLEAGQPGVGNSIVSPAEPGVDRAGAGEYSF